MVITELMGFGRNQSSMNKEMVMAVLKTILEIEKQTNETAKIVHIDILRWRWFQQRFLILVEIYATEIQQPLIHFMFLICKTLHFER